MRLVRFAKQKLVAMIESGDKAEVIAAAIGMSRSSVYSHARRLGPGTRGAPGGPATVEGPDQRPHLWSLGEMSTTEIAAHFGCCPSTVRRADPLAGTRRLVEVEADPLPLAELQRPGRQAAHAQLRPLQVGQDPDRPSDLLF